MSPHYPNGSGGYAALLTALIVGTLLSILAFAAGTSTFFARFDGVDHESHAQAVDNATSCLYAALYTLVQDTSYQPQPQVIGGICHIDAVIHSGTTFTIETSASVRSARARLEGTAIATSSTAIPVLKSWREINSS
jgi:hypothetical protein